MFWIGNSDDDKSAVFVHKARDQSITLQYGIE